MMVSMTGLCQTVQMVNGAVEEEARVKGTHLGFMEIRIHQVVDTAQLATPGGRRGKERVGSKVGIHSVTPGFLI